MATELRAKADYGAAHFTLKTGQTTAGYPLSEEMKTQIKADHPAQFDHLVAADLAADAADALVVSTAAALAAAIADQTIKVAAKATADAAKTAADTAVIDATTAHDDAVAAAVITTAARSVF